MSHLTESDVVLLETRAREIRALVIDMLEDAGSGHTAGPLDMADLFAVLYFRVLHHDPARPDLEERDRLVLSSGHTVPVRYAAMALAGYMSIEEAKTLRKFGSRVQGHPERTRFPALETTSGPLGEGLSQACGMAYGLRMDGRKERVYCVMSDAEQQCGNTWEAALFAGARRIANLTAIIDRNNIQIGGHTEDVLPLEPLRQKYEAMNWHVLEVDGHNIEMLSDAFDEARALYEKPTVIIAHTIPGKGVPEIEFDYRWHGAVPSSEEEKRFMRALRTLQGKVAEE